jgi:hypothetical protein
MFLVVSSKFSSWVLIFVLMAALHFPGIAQDFKRNYRFAKDLFNSANYSAAMEAFKPLIVYDKENPYSEYASYYYALSAYRLGYAGVAKDMLLQVKRLYPQWNQIDEVNYLLARIYFERKEYFQGMLIAGLLRDPAMIADITNVKKFSLNQVEDVETLRMLHEEHPTDELIARVLVKKISQQPFHQQDTAMISYLIRKFHFSTNEVIESKEMRPKLKDTYQIALVMPFLASTLDPSPLKKRNQFVLDLYEGMKMAADTLARSGINLKLHAYDNERSMELTNRLLKEPELRQVDLIVGPLFQEEAKPVVEFSRENEISLVVSPLSNNSDFNKQNPFAFLFQPSHEMLAVRSAEFAASHALKKNCMVYYGESSKDSLMAAQFIARAHELNFPVLYAGRVRNESSGDILSQLATAIEFDEWKNPKQFTLKKDSIGCIFVASSNELIYSKVINSVETRGDSILVIGQETWLDNTSVDYSKYERIKVALAAPNFRSLSQPAYLDFRRRYMHKHGSLPTDYACTGYEFILTMGKWLSRYGSNFLQTTGEGVMIEGSLTRGYRFSAQRTNSLVPFVSIKGGQLVSID